MDDFQKFVTSSKCTFSYAGMAWDNPTVLSMKQAWDAAMASERERCVSVLIAMAGDEPKDIESCDARDLSDYTAWETLIRAAAALKA